MTTAGSQLGGAAGLGVPASMPLLRVVLLGAAGVRLTGLGASGTGVFGSVQVEVVSAAGVFDAIHECVGSFAGLGVGAGGGVSGGGAGGAGVGRRGVTTCVVVGAEGEPAEGPHELLAALRLADPSVVLLRLGAGDAAGYDGRVSEGAEIADVIRAVAAVGAGTAMGRPGAVGGLGNGTGNGAANGTGHGTGPVAAGPSAGLSASGPLGDRVPTVRPEAAGGLAGARRPRAVPAEGTGAGGAAASGHGSALAGGLRRESQAEGIDAGVWTDDDHATPEVRTRAGVSVSLPGAGLVGGGLPGGAGSGGLSGGLSGGTPAGRGGRAGAEGGFARPGEAAALADAALVETLLAGGEPCGEAIGLLRAGTGRDDLHFVPAAAGGVAAGVGEAGPALLGGSHGALAVPVVHQGRRLGLLVAERVPMHEAGAADLAERLRPHAAWLGGWVSLGRQVRSLRKAAFTDPLTGAWNRRYFDRFLRAAIDHARSARLTLTVLVFDIDSFKQYNDQFGHPAGDEILVETVRALKSVIRPSDRVCRIGGDEFAVIFYEPTGPRAEGSRPPESVYVLTQRVQRKIREHKFPKLGAQAAGHLTISGGLATFPWDGADAVSLLERADELAIQSKRAGKNAITLGPGAERVCGVHGGE